MAWAALTSQSLPASDRTSRQNQEASPTLVVPCRLSRHPGSVAGEQASTRDLPPIPTQPPTPGQVPFRCNFGLRKGCFGGRTGQRGTREPRACGPARPQDRQPLSRVSRGQLAARGRGGRGTASSVGREGLGSAKARVPLAAAGSAERNRSADGCLVAKRSLLRRPRAHGRACGYTLEVPTCTRSCTCARAPTAPAVT